MPGESGLDLYRRVCTEYPALSTHFVLVTGDGAASEIAGAPGIDPGAVLRKPFDLAEYSERVSGLLRTKRAGASG
jgi:DNA-binding response OmpR family regulator